MEGRIDLAHQAPFRLGALEVRPALRQLARDDGSEEVLEPRVMQVLVALARTDGAIVGRDDLTRSCWEGRVVGEDAINRVVSRLRRAAEGIGQGAFRIETITKVGYRLLREGQAGTPAPAPDSPLAQARAEAHRLRLDRRAMLAGSGLAAVSVGGGLLAWRHWSKPAAAMPDDVKALLDQAMASMRQGTPEGLSQATGLFRRLTEQHPEQPDAWGALAIAYAIAAGGGSPQNEAALRLRTEQAAERALRLDAANPYGRLARAMLNAATDSWRADEALCRSILASHPDIEFAWGMLGGLLLSVGRCAEAADTFAQYWAKGVPDPSRAYTRAVALWAANRLDEADKASEEAISLFPTHFAVWFTRFYLLLYTGRAADALAMSRKADQRPTGIPQDNFAMIEEVAQAMITRAPADIDRAMTSNLAAAHKGAGFAENTIQFAAAHGRVDTAFEVAEGYYFGRGFTVGELRFQPEQRVWTRQRNRRTRLLFMPSTASMRTDPRFGKLVAEIGLERYWRESGTVPDYRKA
ncbi:winged helix-turn-helix domain-containing protein [Sphingomonas sp. Sphisp140]|uniref:winged helix-turn-helix domain-containing protein n=1 Tax=unclassified Sphingomonas TaxID=196159 RepID=UPI0039AF111B